MPFGKDNLILLSDETRKVMYDVARKMPENIAPNPNVPTATAVAEKRWRVGGLEFEALMRMLDNAVSSANVYFSFIVRCVRTRCTYVCRCSRMISSSKIINFVRITKCRASYGIRKKIVSVKSIDNAGSGEEGKRIHWLIFRDHPTRIYWQNLV